MTAEWDGMPLNPEQEAPHRVFDTALGREIWAMWSPDTRSWWSLAERMDVRGASKYWRYVGPCILTSDIDAAVEAEREACAAALDCGCALAAEVLEAVRVAGENSGARWHLCPHDTCRAIEASSIRARSTGPSALAEHTARVRREALLDGLREAAGICALFARNVREEEGPSGPEPEYGAAMACVDLLEKHIERVSRRALLTEADDAAG